MTDASSIKAPPTLKRTCIQKARGIPQKSIDNIIFIWENLHSLLGSCSILVTVDVLDLTLTCDILWLFELCLKFCHIIVHCFSHYNFP